MSKETKVVLSFGIMAAIGTCGFFLLSVAASDDAITLYSFLRIGLASLGAGMIGTCVGALLVFLALASGEERGHQDDSADENAAISEDMQED